MNFNDASGTGLAFELAEYERRHLAQGVERMTYDHPGYRGSLFAYRSTRTAALLVDVVNATPVKDRQRPEELVSILDQIVRLQAVKCSPPNTQASKPTNDMWDNCPPMLLADELEIAAPRFVIAFGSDAAWAIAPMLTNDPIYRAPRLHSGTIRAHTFRATVLMVDHPAARGHRYWPTSHASLAEATWESAAWL
jgi:hypothetical protein